MSNRKSPRHKAIVAAEQYKREALARNTKQFYRRLNIIERSYLAKLAEAERLPDEA